ncbi:hypothetical protein [Desulfurobacterium indicum]|uniref:DUF302 domain-containing protein n=1 Tax=Desulfurobacterium indicum TaxID=1914305 RepID=A0A1R1MJD9_9BACT|nr:hypothetical protein [Desulfurobacterium indicum]OMH39866.1 hypothetical protein BLW93_08260 [Desulfurobacterium indicum]
MKRLIGTLTLVVVALFAFVSGAFAGEKLQPFILSKLQAKTIEEGMKSAEKALKDAGFQIVGSYMPEKDVGIIVITNPELLKLAKNTEYGAFGAVERVAVVNRNGKVEVSYTNPEYWFNAFRMEGNITPVKKALAVALGDKLEYGAKNGIDAEDLRDYNYKCCMPKFDDFYELGEYDSHAQGVQKIEKNLKAKVAGVAKVYRVDIPGTKATLFGVEFTQGQAADKFILSHIDVPEVDAHSHAAHLPYELLVVGDKAIALNGKFRIAISWPYLGMFGKHGFMSIKQAPDDIEKQLKEVATK